MLKLTHFELGVNIQNTRVFIKSLFLLHATSEVSKFYTNYKPTSKDTITRYFTV